MTPAIHPMKSARSSHAYIARLSIKDLEGIFSPTFRSRQHVLARWVVATIDDELQLGALERCLPQDLADMAGVDAAIAQPMQYN